ncbi:MAG TPA: ATP-binding protein [Chthonomonadaceae bacterium]|nr:ATP-binding protein [Chthonomonadaceae bacterium]
MPPSQTPRSQDLDDTPRIPLLLADDDPLLRQALASALTAGGYCVTCAGDGLEALELAQREHFALVVADMEMPHMNGVELVAALEELDPSIECILLSGIDNLERIVLAAEMGNVYNHFWKPLENFGDLVRAVARALERRELRRSQARLLSELRDTREELSALCGHLEQLDKVAALGHMTAAVVRDLESPLMGLLNYAQYLRARLERDQEAPLTAEQADRILDYLRGMERGIRQCHRAVEGILDYTRIHEEPPGPVHLHETLGEALELIQSGMEAQGASLALHLADSLPPVLANPRRLQQALLSVLLNSQQAVGKSGGVVAVTTEALTDETGRAMGVCVRVSDTGPGIAPAVMPYIFDPFFTTRPRPGSLGLGLTIARNIVRSWHGDIRVESAPGKGTVVSLTLPACMEMAVPLDVLIRDRRAPDWEDGPDSAERAA